MQEENKTAPAEKKEPENEVPDGSFSKRTVIRYGIIIAVITVVLIVCAVIAFRLPGYFGQG